MPDASLGLLILIITLAVGFGVVNGLNDAANAIATVVGTRVLSPRNAVILAAVANLLGAATGTAVAITIGKGILIPEAISNETVVAALAAVIIWATVATYYGLPVSLTHSFVAAFAAAGLAAVGSGAINWAVMGKVLASVVTAPVLGFIGGFALMVALLWIFRKSVPAKVRIIFSRLQVLSSFFIAYSHGKNDGQMPIGIITLALVAYTGDQLLWDNIPLWVILLSAGAISFGTATGGWRVMKTLGLKVTTLRPIHGFAAQTAGAAVIEGASWLGIPVSTTHCISTSIMGVGATRRLSAVRWGVAGNIVTAWIITFPICGALGYILASLFGLMS
jgi:PiT family inorganic phosphate transporter